ncbi:MAG: type III pantothenate kinase [Acidobacteria bacterium]|nr:type III pantothenate kinase [Acidobacteriota bacterium]
MFLAIDIGNTNITLGLYEGDTAGPRWRLATDHERTADEYGASLREVLCRAGIETGNVRSVAIASVVPPLTGVFEDVSWKCLRSRPLIVDSSVKTGIRILCDAPEQIGADRIVDVAAGFALYGGPACVIDLGTATTFDAVSADGDYLGGAITPGIGIAAEALSRRAARLPRVELRPPPSAIGRNATQSLQSGLLLGYVGLVEGMVARFRAELGPDTRVIATGGLAGVIARETDSISVLAPWLTLDGLRIIYELNRGRDQ